MQEAAVRYWLKPQVSASSTGLHVRDGSLTQPAADAQRGAIDQRASPRPLHCGSPRVAGLLIQIKAPNAGIPAAKVEVAWLSMT